MEQLRYPEQNQLHFYIFHPKSETQLKAVIRQLPEEIAGEDIANQLLAMGYKVLNVGRMTTG